MKADYLQTNNKSHCYGCGSCAISCPTKSIQMQLDERGFLFPEIDLSKCVDCGICHQVCPYELKKNNTLNVLYACSHLDNNVKKYSQTGGLFTAISDYIIKQNGAVYGAAICEDFSVKHIRADNLQERDRMRGSKYTVSIIEPNVVHDLEKDINNGLMVLFSGTPCQCAMVRKKFGKKDNLLIVDFICHGTPSPMLWKDYLAFYKLKYGSIKHTVFRLNKYAKKGVHTELVIDGDDKEHFSCNYAALFYSHLGHRESCFECQFANKIRFSDITMGGFLDKNLIDLKDDEYDLSMCLINTEKGFDIFKKIKADLRCELSNIEQNFRQQPCLYHPVAKPDNYDSFWIKYLSDKEQQVCIWGGGDKSKS